MSTGLHCQAHSGEHYTNFCTAIQCFHPLCPECIDDHVMFHKTENTHCEVASIITVKINCEKKIKTGQDILKEKLNQPQVVSLSNPELFYQNQVQLLQVYKLRLHDRIDLFCEQILAKMRATLQHGSQQQVVVGNINSVMQQFSYVFDSLKTFHTYKKADVHEKSKQVLQQEEGALDHLRKACQLDVKSLIDRLSIDLKKACKDVQTFSFNDNSLHVFDQALSEVICLSSEFHPEDFRPPFEEFKSRSASPIPIVDIEDPYSKNSSFLGMSNIQPTKTTPPRYQQTMMATPNQQPQQQQQLATSNLSRQQQQQLANSNVSRQQQQQLANSNVSRQLQQQASPPQQTIQQQTYTNFKTQSYDPIEINVSNYFLPKTTRKILHFFKLNDKILYELDLSTRDNSFRMIQMNIPFLIPQFFSSIVTPQGDIYLLGGSTGQQPIQKKPEIYCYEHINRQLIKCGRMITARSSFSTCVVFPYIYSFCGLVAEGMTRNTERYHILTSQSESMTDSLYAGIAPAVAHLATRKLIFKFGGNLIDSGKQCHVVEQFCLSSNMWTEMVIQSKSAYAFHQFSAASQINDSELIVFGGYDRDNIGYDQSFRVKVLETDVIVEETWHLPRAEGFWSSQCIQKDNKLFALQNLELEDTHDVDETRRSIVMLTTRGWMTQD